MHVQRLIATVKNADPDIVVARSVTKVKDVSIVRELVKPDPQVKSTDHTELDDAAKRQLRVVTDAELLIDAVERDTLRLLGPRFLLIHGCPTRRIQLQIFALVHHIITEAEPESTVLLKTQQHLRFLGRIGVRLLLGQKLRLIADQAESLEIIVTHLDNATLVLLSVTVHITHLVVTTQAQALLDSLAPLCNR